MRRISLMLLCLLLSASLAGCRAASSEERTGQAQGYGGTLSVRIRTRDGKLSDVEVTDHKETQGIGTRAIDALPAQMVESGTWNVDGVSGATVTSNALRQAVAAAMGEEYSSGGTVATPTETRTQAEAARSGMGMSATGRIGPGTDAQGNPVYSINVVFAHGTFDDAGRILSMAVDQLEVATPNYGGEGTPHFSGFPGQGGYALHDDAAGEISGKTGDSEEDFLAEVSEWTSKRGRGEDYRLEQGSWASQMDAYQTLFTGKTVDEVEAWFARYFSEETGRPLQSDSDSESDRTQISALSEEEKQTLSDITSSATISLRDSHGDILLAIRRAWEDAQQQ